MQEKYRRQLKKLGLALEEEKKKRLDSEEKRLYQLRDQSLTEALTKSDCVDLTGGMRYFRDNLQYDEEEGEWKYITDDGVDLSIAEGVKENMPDYLKKSSVGQGGSGSTQITGMKAVNAMKEQVAALQKKANETGADSDIKAYMKADREYKEAEREATAGKS